MSALHFCHVYFRNFTLGVCTLIVLAVINKLISFLEILKDHNYVRYYRLHIS